MLIKYAYVSFAYALARVPSTLVLFIYLFILFMVKSGTYHTCCDKHSLVSLFFTFTSTVNPSIFVATIFYVFNELIVSLSGCQDPIY